MESPWKILNLDHGSASEKEVKSAYARLIKLHRPDTDPAGFQRVREAYEIALAMVRERIASATQPLEGAESLPAPDPGLPSVNGPSQPDPPEALPAALIEAERLVTRAREVGDTDAVRRSIGSLFYVCRSVSSGRACIRMWQESLHRVTGGSSEWVALGLTTSQLIAELEAGYSVLCHACLRHWESTHDLGPIRQLGEGILSEPQRIDRDEAAIVVLRIALELGFPLPNMAMKLVHFAYPHLQRDAKDHYVPQVEQQIQFGGLFVGFREDQMEYWHRRLRRPQEDHLWTGPPSEAALEYVSTVRAPAWAGYDLLGRIAPPEWMARLQSVMRRKHGGLLGRFKPIALGSGHSASTATTSRWPQLPRPAWALVFYGLYVIIRLVAIDSNNPSPPPSRTVVPGWDLASRLPPSPSLLPPLPVRSSGLAPQSMVVPSVFSDPLRRVDQAREMFNASLSVPSPSLGTLSSLPASQEWARFNPAVNYRKGSQACADRVVELRKQARVTSWLNVLVTMHKNGADPAWNATQVGAKEKTFRMEVQSFFKNLADSDASVEHLVLELLLLDPAVPELLKQEAVYRQSVILPVTSLIEVWKLAATDSFKQAMLIATFASWYLDKHGKDLTVSTADRRELEILVRNQLR